MNSGIRPLLTEDGGIDDPTGSFSEAFGMEGSNRAEFSAPDFDSASMLSCNRRFGRPGGLYDGLEQAA
jgi:hypothetical protein